MFTKYNSNLWVLLSLLILIVPNKLHTQDIQANNWIFGNSSQLTFLPELKTNYVPDFYHREGVSTVSDDDGNLLFYINGVNVWDKNNEIMSNGTNLMGHNSSTQGCLIVRNPIERNLYYIFTTGAMEDVSSGLYYNIVDINSNSVIVKNQLLLNEFTEKLSAVNSHDKKTIYIITKEYKTKKYLVYSLSNTLNETPTEFIGNVEEISDMDRIGSLKFFSGGTKFAAVHYDSGILEFGNFRPSTGNISKLDTIEIFPGLYGVEFSPDGRYLYITTVTTPSFLFQLNLDTKELNTVFSTSDFQRLLAGIQIGIDGRIYVSEIYKDHLNVIKFPNNDYIFCDFSEREIQLKENSQALLGLPNLNQSWYYKYNINEDKIICEGNGTLLRVSNDTENTDPFTEYVWINPSGDTISTKRQFLTGSNIEEGEYTSIITNKTGTFTQTTNIIFKERYEATFNYPDEIVICDSNEITLRLDLESNIENYNIEWSTGDTTQKITVDESGNYLVKVSDVNDCFSETFKFSVFFNNMDEQFKIQTKEDVDYCNMDSLLLFPNLYNDSSLYKHIWISNGGIIGYDDSLAITESGMYYLTIIDKKTNCKQIDSIRVDFFNENENIIVEDSVTICYGDSYLIEPILENENDKIYEWSNFKRTKNLTVDSPGLYILTVTDTTYGCSIKDSIRVDVVRNDLQLVGNTINSYKYVDDYWGTMAEIKNIKGLSYKTYMKDGVNFRTQNDSIIFINNRTPGIYHDTMIVETTEDTCNNIYEVSVTVENRARIFVEINDTVVNIGDTICIDIHFKDLNNLILDETNIEIDFGYDDSIFHPLDLQSEYKLQDTITICGIILLNNQDESLIEILNVTSDNEFLEFILSDAKLYINDICIQPLRQIQQLVPLQLYVYPNPTSGKVNIQYTGPPNKEIQIYSIDGQLVYAEVLNNNEGNIYLNEAISNGAYIIRLQHGTNMINEIIIVID